MTLASIFCAPDRDDKTIGNGQVTYNIDSITPGIYHCKHFLKIFFTNNNIKVSGTSSPPPDGSNLLAMIDTADFCAVFELNMNLKGFYGLWNLEITVRNILYE